MLGIKFHVDLKTMIKLNYEDKIKKMKRVISNWNRRVLTPIGRITVVKTLLISLFIHLFTSLPTPAIAFINDITNTLIEFVWQGKNRIKKEVIYKQLKEGG